MTTAKIREVHIAAAHDGEAELLVTLEYGNGGRTQVTLDEFAARVLLTSCQTEKPDELIGADWVLVRDALIASSERYADNTRNE